MSTRPNTISLQNDWVLLVSVVVGCVGLAELGHSISFPGNFATFWPNAGFVLGMLVNQPTRRWGWVLFGALIANLISDVGLHQKTAMVSCGFWVANSIESLIAALLVRRLSRERYEFVTVRRVLQFVFLPCMVSTILGAIVGAAVVCAAFGAEYWTTVQVWWSGDFIGMLVVFPFFQQALQWEMGRVFRSANTGASKLDAVSIFQFVCLLLLHLAITQYVFGAQHEPLAYVVFPTLLWLVIRFEQLGANSSLLLTAIVIVANSASGRGLFGDIQDIESRAGVVQVFLFVTSVTFLSLAGAMRERSTARRQLVKSQETIEQAPYAVFWVTMAGQLQYANQQASVFLGYDHDRLMEKPLHELCSESSCAEWGAFLQQSGADQCLQFEGHLRHKNGDLLESEFRLSFIDLEGERLAVAAVSDITKRRAVVRDLIATKQQLEAYIGLIGTTDGSWSWNVNSGEVHFSSRFRELLGYGSEDGEGFPNEMDSLSKAIHPDHKDEFWQLVENHFSEGTMIDGEFQAELASGEFRWFRIRANTTRDSLGDPVILAGSMFEVTDRKTAELRLQRSNTDLEQFAYVASHDLQEPLRAISGFCQLLERRYGEMLDEKGRGYIQNAVEGVARMTGLIQDLLEFSRVGRDNVSFQMVPLHEVVHEAAENLSEQISERQAKIQIVEPLPELWGERAMLKQLFQNLLSNAIKFCPAERVPLVSVSAQLRGPFWSIFVEDNGCGIPPDYRRRIFTIFKRLHRREEVSGSGIGLAICKRVVDRHAGKIQVESGDDVGSRFVIEFPLRESSDVRT